VIYKPDFEEECYICGASPCVIVEGHVVPDTMLCGVHFFHNDIMSDWSEWNEQPEEEEDDQ
jgi:hypothetical protein